MAVRRHAAANHRAPWPVAVLFALTFTVGMVAVALATQVVVPAMLRFLSLFFASRALTSASNAVREAGEVAVLGMDRSRRWLLTGAFAPRAGDSAFGTQPSGAGDGRVRVRSDSAGVKVRVEASDTGGHEADAADAADDDLKAPGTDESTR